GARFVAGGLRGGGVGRVLFGPRIRRLAPEPAPTLRERLRMRDDALDRCERRPGAREETVTDRQRHLGADAQRRFHEEVEGVRNHASVEFSTGTTPRSARPLSTSWKTSATV